MRRAIAIATFFAFALCGCMSHGVMVSDAQASSFERGKTTEAEVIARLGQPTTVSSYNGQRTLIYSGAQAQARPATFIPIIGPLVGGADVRTSSVMFRFGADGKLSDVISNQSASGTANGPSAGTTPPVENTPRKVQ